MANVLLGFPNHVESTFVDVVFFGGSWEATLPLSNLITDDLSQIARSTSANTDHSKFYCDLGSLRNVLMINFSSHNGSRNGGARIRGTSTIKWQGVVVNANGSAGASSVSFKNNNVASVEIDIGDAFTIGGYTYESDSNATLTGSGGTATINLKAAPSNPGDLFATLQANISENDPIICNVGLFDGATEEVDFSTADFYPIVYPFGTLPWGHPALWDGRATEEERQQLVFPFINILDLYESVRYLLVEIDDPLNEDGFIAISKLFVTPGWQPSMNMKYGATFQYTSETTYEQTISGIKKYDVKEPRRVDGFTIDHLELNEAVAQGIDMQRYLGTNKQLFYVKNPDAEELLHRISYTATMRTLGPMTDSYFNRAAIQIDIEEVLGGKLT